MTPLIDGDVLLHELGWSAQFKDKDTGEQVLFQFDKVMDMLDAKIELICNEAGATEEPVLYFSDSLWLAKRQGREYVPNFRYAVATIKPYKGTRNNPKPFHFYNILMYLLATRNCVISSDGVEADDEMVIEQFSRLDKMDTIICSRDKDLRICEGWHYSWECGKQHSMGPHLTDRIGHIELNAKGEVKGYGLTFFFAQMIMGDTADNIGGLPRKGDKAAWTLLKDLKTEEEMLAAVKDAYKDLLGVKSKDYFMENMKLLWMVHKKGEFYV